MEKVYFVSKMGGKTLNIHVWRLLNFVDLLKIPTTYLLVNYLKKVHVLRVQWVLFKMLFLCLKSLKFLKYA